MKKWQYAVVVLDKRSPHVISEPIVLTDWGEKGYELVTVISKGWRRGFYFKRQVKADEYI